MYNLLLDAHQEGHHGFEDWLDVDDDVNDAVIMMAIINSIHLVMKLRRRMFKSIFTFTSMLKLTEMTTLLLE